MKLCPTQPTEASTESDVEEGESGNLDYPEHIYFLPAHLRRFKPLRNYGHKKT